MWVCVCVGGYGGSGWAVGGGGEGLKGSAHINGMNSV